MQLLLLLPWLLSPFLQPIHARHLPERGHPAVLQGSRRFAPGFQPGEGPPPNKIPPGRHGLTVKDYNLYLGDTKLSSTGTAEAAFEGDYAIFPSQDGKFAIAYQYSQLGTNRTITLVESSPPDQLQPKVQQILYSKPGDQLRLERPRLFDLEKKKPVAIAKEDEERFYANPFELHDAGWSLRDDRKYRFVYNARGHQLLRMLELDRQTGAVRVLVEESDELFIDWTNKVSWDFFNHTDQMWWTSERDGHNHVYLYNTTTARPIRQLTRGDFDVFQVEHVDEAARVLWFRGFGLVPHHDPYYMHMAKINLDGTGLEVVTRAERGYHRFEWKENFTHFEDRWSRMPDLPMKGVLRDARDGRVIREIREEVMDHVMDGVTVAAVELFNSTARDGNTLIYGIIVKPQRFDATKKYPIIEYVYAGPQDFYVPKELTLDDQRHLLHLNQLADELDVVVVQADGMGTNWRGKDFHSVCHKDLKDAGFEDRIGWIKAAAASRPWMNTGKVGIYGSSAGGQNALAALLWHGDFYQAAIADAGCHDNRMYKIWWNEQWMGWPVDNTYSDSSNVVHAGRLNGTLLLYVGELDQNVDPSSTMQVVNALNDAGKDYQMLVVPGGSHGVLQPGWWQDAPGAGRLVTKFWKKWLSEEA